jgi:hypothetical protein
MSDFKVSHYRNQFKDILSEFNFCEKKRLIKKINEKLLSLYNRNKGKDYLHTLEYLKKIPYKHEDNSINRILYLFRNIILKEMIKEERNEKVI